MQWAHAVRHRFDGGQLYADLHGFATVTPLRPVDALTGFLTALGVPAERVPAGEDQAAALYRTLLAGRRVLVVLDNARDSAQVRPLLPGGPGGMVLVTSRDKLGGLVVDHGAGHLALDVLTPGEAEALLARVLGSARPDVDPTALATLARRCAYLPLALRIAAANLTMYPKRAVAEQLAELETGDRLDALTVDGAEQRAVRAAFELSYGCLQPPEQRLFRRIGLLPGADLTVEDATAVLGTDPTGEHSAAPSGTDPTGGHGAAVRGGVAGPALVRRLLGRLVDAHLIDEHGDGRYGCHDLLRLYAAELAAAEEPPDQRQAALDRLYAGYLGRARAAADLLYPHMLRLPGPTGAAFPDEAAALAWLAAERTNLVLAVRHAAGPGPARAGWLLADALRGYFHLRRYTREWLVVAEAALAAARREADLAGQAAAQHSLGTAYRSMSDHRAALRHYAQALRLSRRCGWRESEATTLGNLGIVCRKLGRLGVAARHLESALALDRQLGRAAGEANNAGLLASVYQDMGRLPDALQQLTSALALNTAIGSRHGEALVLTGLGQVCHELGRPAEARRHLAEALARYTQVGDRDGTAVVSCALSAVERADGRPELAREHALAALALAGDTGDRQTEIIARTALGAADVLLGAPQEAVEQHELAWSLAIRTASRRLECEALLGLAVAHQRLGGLDRAGDLARQALELAEHNGFQVVVGTAHHTLAGICRAAGRTALASEHDSAALVSRHRTGQEPRSAGGSQPAGRPSR